jgi:hypothetical protein
MKRLAKAVAMAGAIAVGQATTAGAQDKRVPPELIPPKGMCRILIDDVPVSQQPAPTDCKTAVKNKPANGRVIFGDDYVKKDDPRRPDPKPPETRPPTLPRGTTTVVIPTRIRPPE